MKFKDKYVTQKIKMAESEMKCLTAVCYSKTVTKSWWQWKQLVAKAVSTDTQKEKLDIKTNIGVNNMADK